MFSLTFLTRRRPELTFDEFVRHYRGAHFALGSMLPGLISYQQTLLVKGKSQAPWEVSCLLETWDALSIYTFESAEAAETAFASDAGTDLNDDTGLFMERESVLALPGVAIERWEAGRGALTLEGGAA